MENKLHHNITESAAKFCVSNLDIAEAATFSTLQISNKLLSVMLNSKLFPTFRNHYPMFAYKIQGMINTKKLVLGSFLKCKNTVLSSLRSRLQVTHNIVRYLMHWPIVLDILRDKFQKSQYHQFQERGSVATKHYFFVVVNLRTLCYCYDQINFQV